ncbi:MAG: tRNA (guanosine(37)-N1)-methyltransferase TrmD, partial [Proteobacteria bacterium]|nr:tRNA (guanosine(37)-N1)-methyltransferase TrmD [Pseudomonadota bacterium]
MIWNVGFITIYPDIISTYFRHGVLSTAVNKNIVDLTLLNLRDFAADKHGSIDDSPYGGGDGMVMRPDCLANACEHLFQKWGQRGNVVYTSPAGNHWHQERAEQLSASLKPTIFICGRFSGVDQRFIDTYVTHEISFGDFVLAGGELPCLMVAESILRLIPGVLGNLQSFAEDSFSSKLHGLLEYPQYTRPEVWNHLSIPPILLTGDHKKIHDWRMSQSKIKTELTRPDLFAVNP